MADVVDDPALAAAGPPPRRLVRKFAAAIAGYYRNLDPVVAQVWVQPGVPPYLPPEHPETEAPDG
jgi:hypothetical protein